LEFDRCVVIELCHVVVIGPYNWSVPIGEWDPLGLVDLVLGEAHFGEGGG
jgi:hypothetical protein